jgi:hypothetical protein
MKFSMKRLLLSLLLIAWAGSSFAQYNHLENGDHLPDDFPIPEIVFSDNPSPGYFFLSPAGLWGYFPNATPYLMIIDNFGTPVFFEEQTSAAFDFKIQIDSTLTYAYGTRGKKHYVLNDKLEFVRDLAVVGFPSDFHELMVMQDSNYLMLANEYRVVDMDTVVEGGHQGVTVIGARIQIQNRQDSVLFSWSTFDHFKITDAADHVDLTDPYSIDYVHTNSVDSDTDSTIIISSKNLHELTRINTRTGDIIWRMGGKNNMFSFDSDTSIFSAQHDFRKLENGQYSLFDNNWFSGVEGSRGMILELDEVNYKATLIKQFKSFPELIEGYIMGNLQSLPNGNWVVGWGSGAPNFTEFKAAGSKALEVRYDAVSYRAFKYDWKPMAFSFDSAEAVFGDVSIYEPTSMSFELTNHLQEDIEINYIHQHEDYFTVTNPLPIAVEANASTTIEIQFMPDSTNGVFKDLLTFCRDTENDSLSRRIAVQLPVQANATDGSGVEEDLFNQVSVYPNPFMDILVIEIGEKLNDDTRLVLFNALGQVVYTSDLPDAGQFTISTAEFPKGLYQFMLISKDGKRVQKLIKY